MNKQSSFSSGEKQCTKCGTWYPATTEFFSPNKRIKCGLSSWCRKCRCAAEAKRQAEHHDEYLAYQRKHYRENKEQYSVKAQEYRAENHEAVSLRQHDWYLENRDRILEERKLYTSKNAEQINAHKRRYYRLNADAINEGRKHQYHNDLEESRRRGRAYYWSNPDRSRRWSREAGKRWRENHPEEDKEKHKKWKRENRVIVRISSHRRRARLLQAGGNHTQEDIERIYNQQRGRCYWCLSDLDHVYHIDHRIPLVRGGSNDASNLVMSCPKCNMSKGGKLPHEWCGRLL
jgi:hypothetical protein